MTTGRINQVVMLVCGDDDEDDDDDDGHIRLLTGGRACVSVVPVGPPQYHQENATTTVSFSELASTYRPD